MLSYSENFLLPFKTPNFDAVFARVQPLQGACKDGTAKGVPDKVGIDLDIAAVGGFKPPFADARHAQQPARDHLPFHAEHFGGESHFQIYAVCTALDLHPRALARNEAAGLAFKGFCAVQVDVAADIGGLFDLFELLQIAIAERTDLGNVFFQRGRRAIIFRRAVELPLLIAADKNVLQPAVVASVHGRKPLPLLTAYKDLGFDIKDYPNAYAMYDNEITLPLHTKLSDEEVDYVIDTFRKSLNEE